MVLQSIVLKLLVQAIVWSGGSWTEDEAKRQDLLNNGLALVVSGGSQMGSWNIKVQCWQLVQSTLLPQACLGPILSKPKCFASKLSFWFKWRRLQWRSFWQWRGRRPQIRKKFLKRKKQHCDLTEHGFQRRPNSSQLNPEKIKYKCFFKQ